jgi:polysaccharide export outer membrane protein
MISIRAICKKMVVGLFFMAAASTAAVSQPSPSAPAAAASIPPVVPATAPAFAVSSDYVLGPEDVIDVDLLGRADFKTRAKLSGDGTIQLPLIGRISAADRTARVLGDQIRKALQDGGYFSDPIVNVDVVSYASRYVTVLGAVGSPGLVPVDRVYHLSEIIARVGGVRETGADYVILRRANGPEQRLSVKALATGDPSQDPVVQPGDKIFSPVADLFYISGQVNSPGSFPLTSDMTLRMAIGRAGGLASSGSEKRVTVTRKGEKVKIGLGDLVQAGDVIVVGERLF